MNSTHAPSPDSPLVHVPELDSCHQRLERIAERAYELYEARGGEHGQDVDDWLQAEQQIDDEIGRLDRED